MDDRIKNVLKVVRSAAKSTEVLYAMGEPERINQKIERISTGSFILDEATGGGLPKGRIVEYFGVESGGKSTLALHAVREAQKAGLITAFIDAEHALDPKWAEKMGVDIENLLISQPGCGEEANTLTEHLLEAGVGLIVVDSVSALVPRAEIDGEFGAAQMGLQARLMSQAMRKLNGLVSNKNAILLYINQIRSTIGVTWGPQETTTGGRALKFYASLRLDVRRKDTLKDGDIAIGIRTKVKVVKNKVAPPFRECEYDLLYASGIDDRLSYLERAVELGWVIKSGAWWSYEGKKAQGWQAFIEALGPAFDEIKQHVTDGEEAAEDVEDSTDSPFISK
jgi:recombination protein RecA